jgi:hypothetical protein
MLSAPVHFLSFRLKFLVPVLLKKMFAVSDSFLLFGNIPKILLRKML